MKGISHPLLQFDFFESRLQFPIQSPVPLVGSFSLSQFPSEVHISSLDIAIKSSLKPPRLLLSAQMPFSIIVWFVPHGPDHAMCFIVPAVPMSYWAVCSTSSSETNFLWEFNRLLFTFPISLVLITIFHLLFTYIGTMYGPTPLARR